MDFSITRGECLWEKLARTERPLVLYGTGNGADKLIAALAAFGKEPSGVFASDGFVRRRTFAGMEVLSFADACQRFGEEMIVLIAFGSSLPGVMEQMRAVAARCETYIPELPLFGGGLFTYDYFCAHRRELDDAFALLADDASRALFTDMLTYRLRGELSSLSRTETPQESYRSLLAGRNIRTAIDGGAFRGDSAAAMLRALSELRTVYAAEPDERSFARLTAYAASTKGAVRPLPYALSDHTGRISFSATGSRGASIGGAARRARESAAACTTIDAIAAHTRIDLIKLDVEGNEKLALAGAAETLRRDLPALAVSVYHRCEDLFAVILQLEAMLPSVYRYHLRRAPCYPAWDLLLLALPRF